MRILLSFFIMVFCSIQSFTQIAATTQSLDCYNDSGNIFLVFDTTTVTSWDVSWQYSTFDSISFIDVDTMNTVNLNSNKDSLRTTRCGFYKAIYYYSTSTSSFGPSSIQWPLACPLTMGQGQSSILCYGDSSGILKRPVFGGDPFIDSSGSEYYKYQWMRSDDSLGSNSYFFSDSTENLFNINAGWYKTIVTDAINCSDTVGFIEFRDPPLLTIDTTFVKLINCRETNTGSIGFHIFGGKKIDMFHKYFYYLIHEGDTVGFSDNISSSDNFSNLFSSNIQSYYRDSIEFDSLYSGQYYLHVIDSNSCLMIDTFLIIDLPPYEAFVSTATALLCESDSGYLVVDSILGAENIIFGFEYDIINGLHTDSIYVSSGWHDLYIEDLDFGCIDTVSVRCYAEYEINIYETVNSVYCFGESSGSIIIDSINGGNSPYDIQWGSIDNSSLFAGNYIVNFVDSIGCLHTEEYTISESTQINTNENVYAPLCNGEANGSIAIKLSGGTGNLDFYWLNSSSLSDSLYGLTSGIYYVIVIDSLMCLDTFSISITDNDSLQLSSSEYQSLLPCFGAITNISLFISGGISPYSILWNDGDTSQNKVLSADTYNVILEDANGCTIPNSIFIVAEPDSLSVSILSSDISCDSFGMASVIVSGGVSPITYLWNTGDTTQMIDSLWESTYWVVVTDSCGNSIIDTVYLSVYELLTEVYFDEVTRKARVEVTSLNTSGPFTHEWFNIFQYPIGQGVFSPILCEGTYFVTTTDISNGCSVIDTIDIVFSLALSSLLDLTTTTVLSDNELWGAAPYTYLWDNGEVAQHADICPGLHWVEVTGSDNCTLRENFQVENLIISLDPASAIIECDLENLDISLEASATGGIEPYSFQWWNGSTENPINLAINPGDLTVSVIDNNQCIEDTSFFIAAISAECVPNIFTPNNDNINDTWALEDTFLYSNSEVRIYGRYGRLLFESIGYHIAWDGTNKKGNDVPSGVYFYSIDIGNGFSQINGTVTILR